MRRFLKKAFQKQMEVEKPTDIFGEVRKDINCANEGKAENAKMLVAIEEGIHGDKKEVIEPDQYFKAMLGRLQSSKTVNRSVAIARFS